MRTQPVSAFLVTCLCLLACGGSQPPPAFPNESPPAPAPTSEPSAPPTEGDASRPELSAQACEASGGAVVGDIGDGAIHRPDYRCPSGAKPSAAIRAPEGGPMAVEGSVCCPK